MFNKLETWNYPDVGNYHDALNAWDKGIKTRDYPTRKWIVHGHRNKWIEKQGAHISFVLGGVKMVTWEGEDALVVTPCNSTASFTLFANAFLPPDLRVEFHAAGSPWVAYSSTLGTRYWRLAQAARMLRERHAWRPMDGIVPFMVPALDRKAANAALRASGFTDFMHWARALVALDGWQRDQRPGLPYFECVTAKGRVRLLQALGNRTEWMAALTNPALTHHTHDAATALRHVEKAMRTAVYAEHKCVTITSEPYLDGEGAIDRWHSNRMKYRSAMVTR